MSERVSLELYKRPDGGYDVEAYERARVANGERCACGGFMSIFHEPPGHEVQCYDCKRIDKPEELDHDRRIRCPKCRHVWDPWDGEEGDFFAEGEHETYCSRCDEKFVVETHVSYSFTSPPMKTEEPTNG